MTTSSFINNGFGRTLGFVQNCHSQKNSFQLMGTENQQQHPLIPHPMRCLAPLHPAEKAPFWCKGLHKRQRVCRVGISDPVFFLERLKHWSMFRFLPCKMVTSTCWGIPARWSNTNVNNVWYALLWIWHGVYTKISRIKMFIVSKFTGISHSRLNHRYSCCHINTPFP